VTVLQVLTAASSIGALLLGAATGLYAAGPSLAVSALGPVPVTAEARPLDRATPSRDRVGRLGFLGAIRLQSPNRSFGGISALLWEPECGRLLAVSDTGNWMILEPAETAGRLTGLAAAWIAPILDESGRPAMRKRAADAEALTRNPRTGDVTVWFEGDHRAQRYEGLSACTPETLGQPAAETLRPDAIRAWPINGGVEAAVATSDGYILFSEEAPGGPGRHAVARIPDGGSSYPATDGFVATDAADAGAAGLLLLSRRFSPQRGVAALLSRLEPGADGYRAVELARLAPPLLVDNMEGLAVRQEADRTTVYLASDNNFNPLQETLLMKFELLP
jgi:hypothetical protein